MLMLAVMTGSITRVTRRSRMAAQEDDLNRQHASGRRAY
jgi:hypothetical protein